MREQKSELKFSAGTAKKPGMTLNLRGPGAVLILISWITAVAAVAIAADGIGRIVGVTLLAFFIAAYFRELSKNPL